MQRRAALARGFILEPEILLMDEPFVSLDDPTASSLRELLMELWHGHPTTVIFVTHDRAEAIQLGTRILRLAPGKASVAQDVTIDLTEAQRHDRAAVLAEQYSHLRRLEQPATDKSRNGGMIEGLRRGRPAFLASVINADEADIALEGGADIIDCKDPASGALGALARDDGPGNCRAGSSARCRSARRSATCRPILTL